MDKYTFSRKELLTYIIIAVSVLCIISYLFYGNIIGMIFFSPSIFFYIKYIRKKKIEKNKEKFKMEFCTAIESLCAPLRAGFSIENSFKKIENEMIMMYGKKSLIVKEIEIINNQVEMNMSIEEALFSFAKRTKIKEIEDFSEVLAISKRADGNMIKVIDFTSKIIREEHETKREITTLISEKKYEASIMKLMPIIILVYMKLCMSEYVDVLYGSVFGVLVMTVLLILYAGFVIIIDKIGRVKV